MNNREKIEQSIICNKYECFICHSTINLDLHHCIHGSGRKPLADEDGLFVALCRLHHTRLHDFGEYDGELKALAQRAYIKEHSREEFLKRYGRFYE